MSRALPTVLVLLAVVSSYSSSLRAAPPTVTNFAPRGAERGKTVEIVVAGTSLTPQTRLLLPFKATQTLLADAKPMPTQVRIQLTVDAGVPIGIYPVRASTEDGISALQFFSVEALPNVNEVKGNNTFEKAQKVPFPVVVNGQCAGGEVGFFRFPAAKDQRVVIETLSARLGSGVLPQIRVTDARQRFIAADDSQSLQGDCRVVFKAMEEGDYIVEVSDSRYRGTAPPHYRLLIGDFDVVEEVFPLGGRRGETITFTLRGGTLTEDKRLQRTLDDAATPGSMLLALDGVIRLGMIPRRVAVGELPERVVPKAAEQGNKPIELTPPVTVNGRLQRKGDTDRFQFAVQPGQRWRIAVQAEALDSYLDGVLRVSDQTGKQLALVDDVDIPPSAPGQPASKSADPSLEITVPANTSLLVVELFDQRKRGGINYGYRLTVEPALADFELRQPVSELNVPRGGTSVLVVPVVRRGFTGPVELSVANLPPFLTVQGGRVPANAAQGLLTLTASADAASPAEPLFLRIEGKGAADGKEMRRVANLKFAVSKEANPASSSLTLSSIALGLTAAEPFALEGPQMIEAVKGYPTELKVMLRRAANVMVPAVEVTGGFGGAAPPAPPAPNVIAFKPATIAANADNGTVTLTPGLASQEATFDIVIQGKAKINNIDRTIMSAAVGVTVHRPFSVELPKAPITLTAGQDTMLKVALNRREVFKEAVQWKLDGLPAGVTLAKPPAPVPGNVAEFTIELKAGAKIAPVTVNPSLTCSTTIGGMAYSHPAVSVPVQVK
jgi:hypothetical protein